MHGTSNIKYLIENNTNEQKFHKKELEDNEIKQ
jgi:hypothetical protein